VKKGKKKTINKQLHNNNKMMMNKNKKNRKKFKISKLLISYPKLMSKNFMIYTKKI